MRYAETVSACQSWSQGPVLIRRFMRRSMPATTWPEASLMHQAFGAVPVPVMQFWPEFATL